MANVQDTKKAGKGDEFSEKPKAAPMVKAPTGKELQARIKQMADAGYEQVEKFAKEVGTQGEAATVIARDELDNLIGQPLVIVHKLVNQGDFGPFVSLSIVLHTDDVVVVNAGGKALEGGGYSGIPGQLDGIEITPDKPHRVPNGLRRSDYDFEDMNQKGPPGTPGFGPNGGKLMPATTYYLDYSDEKNTLFARLKAKTKRPRRDANGTAKPAA
jgi:hypothetical protein